MAESVESQQEFACPHCGTRYRWKPRLARRKVVCRCGRKMRIPEAAGGAAEPIASLDSPPAQDGVSPATSPAPPADRPPEEPDPNEASTYGLAMPEDEAEAASSPHPHSAGGNGSASAPPATPGQCPGCNQDLKPGAVLCLNCGHNLATGERVRTHVADPGDPDEGEQGDRAGQGAGPSPRLSRAGIPPSFDEPLITDSPGRMEQVYLPLILSGVGLMLLLVDAFFLAYTSSLQSQFNISPRTASLAVLVMHGIDLAIMVPCLFAGVLVVAALFSTSFGTLTSALSRLLAIGLLTLAAGAIVNSLLDIITGGFGGLGFMITFAIEVSVFFAACMKLLDTDVLETVSLYIVAILIPSLVGPLLFFVVLKAMFF